jgi:acyl-CoA dehydrogenase
MGAGLNNLEYAPLAEITGRVHWAPEVFNCSAPDTGNMEVFAQYGTPEQQATWLTPLLSGDIRSAFAMTEPGVASSDATNIETRIERDGNDYVINGRKWWISGAGDPRCKIYIVMGKTDPAAAKHAQQSMILVPADAPGVTVDRPLPVFGYDDAPHGHCEIVFKDVRVPKENILLGEGRGFEIAQGRLGPGRIHHCMRLIGLSERALELMCRRLSSRVAFGKPLAAQSVWHERIAESRCLIDQPLLTLKAADMMDKAGNKAAKTEIAMIKVVAPNVAQQVIDWAMQAHGAAGLSDDFPLAYAFAWARILRFADGPDEVHRAALAKWELGKYAPPRKV